MIVESWGFICLFSFIYGIFRGNVGGICLFSGSGGGAFP